MAVKISPFVRSLQCYLTTVYISKHGATDITEQRRSGCNSDELSIFFYCIYTDQFYKSIYYYVNPREGRLWLADAEVAAFTFNLGWILLVGTKTALHINSKSGKIKKPCLK